MMATHPLVPLLIERLERLSADSTWAHRASGLRRALLRSLEEGVEGSRSPEMLMEMALRLLERAARGEQP